MAYSFDQAGANKPSTRKTQYVEMMDADAIQSLFHKPALLLTLA